MSGKRQHFIPLFLQKGFASHVRSSGVFTWLYRKNAQPVNTNIVNVGVESSFYTDGSETKADDVITIAEETFSNLVKELRTISPMCVSDPQIPELIAHLEVRTRHLRQNILQMGDYLVSRYLDFMSDENSYTDYLERTFRNDPSMLREAFADELEKHGLPETMLDTILKVNSPQLPALIEQMKPMLRPFVAYLRSELPRRLSNAAKSGHIRALKKGASPEARIGLYKDLQYAVIDVQESCLILGDSAILFHVKGSKPYKVFIEKDDVLNAVVLPLTSSRLLVGACEGFAVSEHNWTQAIARCSLEYFIADNNSDINRLLQRSIAEDAVPLTIEELEEIITEVMNQ